jgi:hypothetical protein
MEMASEMEKEFVNTASQKQTGSLAVFHNRIFYQVQYYTGSPPLPTIQFTRFSTYRPFFFLRLKSIQKGKKFQKVTDDPKCDTNDLDILRH